MDYWDDPGTVNDIVYNAGWQYKLDGAENWTWASSGNTTSMSFSRPGKYYVRAIVNDQGSAARLCCDDYYWPEHQTLFGAYPSPELTVYVVQVKIMDGSTDVTDQTRNWIIGKQVNLSAEVSPSSVSGSYQWTIPGASPGADADTAISLYTDCGGTSPLAQVTKLTPGDLSTDAVHYYWLDVPGGSVTCTFAAGGRSFVAHTTLNVARPSVRPRGNHNRCDCVPRRAALCAR